MATHLRVKKFEEIKGSPFLLKILQAKDLHHWYWSNVDKILTVRFIDSNGYYVVENSSFWFNEIVEVLD